MDYKIRGYERFSGEFLSIDIKISSKILDAMDDSEKIYLRNETAAFVCSIYEGLKYHAHNLRSEQSIDTTGELNEETETAPIQSQEEFDRDSTKKRRAERASAL